jgi:6-pyruvoyl-tetrahydropterin synthase
MTTLFVDQLTVIDFSYLNHERGLLGESWLVDCELSGELNDEGMLFDFGHVKKTIKHFIDDYADHKLLIAKHTPNLEIETEASERLRLSWHNGHRQLTTSAPAESFLIMDASEITVEALSSLLEEELMKILPSNVSGVKLHLYSETIAGAFYHYSHGLKKHDGNCQRIAHGHRSPIKIYINDERAPSLEADWANRFKDIYIGTREDIVDANDLAEGLIQFAYQAPQGHFDLTINKDQVYLIDTDSTVEWIADHIAKCIHQQQPDNRVKVKAFEGYRKGAIAEY